MHYSLRPWTKTDVDILVKYANNLAIAKNLTDKFPYPYTHTDGEQFINFTMDGSGHHIFAIDINGEACGGIGLHPQSDVHRKNAELGFWLGEPFWGNGIITSAIKEIIVYGFDNIDITRIFARSYGSNLASQRVLEKAGFVLEASMHNTLYKMDAFEDELIFAVRRKA